MVHGMFATAVARWDWLSALLALLAPAKANGPLARCSRCDELRRDVDEAGVCDECFTGEW